MSSTKRGIVAGVVCFVALQLAVTLWCHYVFEGRYESLFLTSERFGLPRRFVDAGQHPVIHNIDGHVGWDGQFYLMTADDPLGCRDTADHLDAVTYRYQRIGIPVLAWLASRLTGQTPTSPWVYLTIQNLLVAIGCGALVWHLDRMAVSPWLTVAWLASGGTLYTLLYGLPDAAADGLFAVAFVALRTGKLKTFFVATTLLCLAREAYVLLPATVFVATLINKLDWTTSKAYALAATAFPAVPTVLWAVYLANHFGVGIASAERNPAIATGRPFVEFASSLAHAWQSQDRQGVAYRLVSMGLLVAVLIVAIREARRSATIACVLPYLALMTCLGPVVWMHHQGYFKAMGTVVIVGIVLVAVTRSRWLAVLLVVNSVIGVDWNVLQAIMPAPFFSPNASVAIDGPTPEHPFGAALNRTRYDEPNREPGRPLRSIDAVVEWVDERPTIEAAYQGLWRFAHRELVPLKIRVTNRGPDSWPATPRYGQNAINLVAVQLDATRAKTIDAQRMSLDREVKPGETAECPLWLRIGRRREVHLHIAVEQVGVHPFDPHRMPNGVWKTVRIR